MIFTNTLPRIALTMACVAACLMPDLLIAATARDEASGLYEQALVHRSKGETHTAIIHLKNALQVDPGLLAAHILLGKIYLKQKQGSDAEKELSIANDLGADRSLTIIPLAEAYLQQDKHKEVLDITETAGFPAPVTARLLVLRGHSYMRLGRLTDAEQSFSKALDLAPRSVHAHLGRAGLFLLREKIEAAEAETSRALKLAPGDGQPWYIRGLIKFVQGDTQGALTAYGNALSLDPGHYDARLARAGILMDRNEDGQALEDMRYLRQAFQGDARVAYFHAVALERVNDHPGAVMALQQADSIIQTLDPEVLDNHARSLLFAGLIKYSLDQHDKAREYLMRSLKLAPNQAGARKLLASILLSMGKNARSISVLKPAMVFAPGDHRLLTLIGTAYLREGQHYNASVALERAIDLAPDATTARFQRALNYAATGKDSLAIDELTLLFDASAQTSKAGLILVMLHFKQGNFAAAGEIASNLIKRKPGSIAVINLHASSQMALGELAAARAGYGQAIMLDPDYLPAQINLARLDLFEGKKQAAEQRLLAVYERHPEHILTMIELARVAESRDSTEAALRWLEKAYATDSLSVPAILALVDIYLRLGNSGAAVTVSYDAQAAMPDNFEILFAWGRSLIAEGEPDRARVVFRRLSRAVGYATEWLNRIAPMQVAAGAPDSAIWSLQKAVEGDQAYLPAQVMLIEVQLHTGQWEKAEKAALVVREQHPEQVIGHQLVGDARFQSGRYREAAKSYRAALAIQKSGRLAIALYAALSLGGAEAQAIDFLRQWVMDNPDEADAMQFLAERHLLNGRHGQARDYFEQVLVLRPDDPLVLNNLAIIHLESDRQKALDYARKSYRLAPDRPAVIDTLGWLLVLDNQAAEGLRMLRIAHSRAAADPEIRYHIAVALTRLGRDKEAKAELEQALGNGTKFNGAEDARELLNQLRNKT